MSLPNPPCHRADRSGSGSPLFAFRSIPPATRYLTATLLAVSALGAFLRITAASSPELGELASYGLFSPAPRQNYPWLYLVPGNVFYTPWTLLVAGFAEGNLIEVSLGEIVPAQLPLVSAELTSPLRRLVHVRLTSSSLSRS